MLNPISESRVCHANQRYGRGDNPHPLRWTREHVRKISIGREGNEKLIFLLENEWTVTTSGGVSSAEEGATVRDKLVSETGGTERLGVLPRFILYKKNTPSEIQK